MKHQLTRDTFALLRSCGNEVHKVEKSKEGTWEPWKLRSRNFSMTSEEFGFITRNVHMVYIIN